MSLATPLKMRVEPINTTTMSQAGFASSSFPVPQATAPGFVTGSFLIETANVYESNTMSLVASGIFGPERGPTKSYARMTQPGILRTPPGALNKSIINSRPKVVVVNRAHAGTLARDNRLRSEANESPIRRFRLYDLHNTWATRGAMAGIDLVTLA
ncbi:MAG: hypothetical protein ACRD9S_24265, partial [Pyrinomonadaceae bacterium]